jgi:hypothetical protein
MSVLWHITCCASCVECGTTLEEPKDKVTLSIAHDLDDAYPDQIPPLVLACPNAECECYGKAFAIHAVTIEWDR